jgi:hypothetical protein
MAEAALSVVLWRLRRMSVKCFDDWMVGGELSREAAHMRYLQSVRHVEGVVWGVGWLFEVVIDV